MTPALHIAADGAPEAPRPLYRELPAPAAFPLDALRPVLANAARAIETVIQCPLVCAANSVLAVASLATQGRANVILPIGQGKPAPLGLYMLTVLDSGERKTSADGMALKPVRDFEREIAESNAGERHAYAAKLSAWEASEKHLTSKMKSDRAALEAALLDLGPAPQPPLLSVIAPSGDQTMEGLFRIYQHGHPSLAMLCDDAASFLGGHSLKAEQKGATTANLCRAWDGSKLERIRGGDGVIVLHDRRLALHLMVQPGVAADFLSDARFADQGLLARFLVSAPVGRAGTRLRDDANYQLAASVAAADLDGYNTAILHLLRQPIRWKDDNDRSLGLELDRLELTDEARALYVAFANAIEGKLAPSGSLVTIKAFASKAPEHAARIAGTLALMDSAGATHVEADTLASAIKLTEYYLSEALRLRAAGWIEPDLRLADELRVWLLEQPGDVIGLRTIYQMGPGAIRQADKARAAMTTLAEHGWVIGMAKGTVIDGARHKEAWRIVRC